MILNQILGLETGISLPNINITGWLTNTWFYVFLIGFIGLILIVTLFLVLFFATFNKKIVFFENISGLGYQPIKKRRARTVKIGGTGEEVMRLLGGGFISAYGRKMGKNTYWFAKGSDGYLYNFLLGDLDAKMAMLDIEPVDKDVRSFYVSMANLNLANYGNQKFWDKHGNQILAFIFMVVLVLSMWFLIGKIGDATAPLAEANKNQAEINEINLQITQRLDTIVRNLNIKEPTGTSSGLVPANNTG
jgi:uncharacterized membrane protein